MESWTALPDSPLNAAGTISKASRELGLPAAAAPITRSGTVSSEALHFRAEETITPDQTGAYKLAWHRERLRDWCQRRGVEHPDAVWATREACIEALREAPD